MQHRNFFRPGDGTHDGDHSVPDRRCGGIQHRLRLGHGGDRQTEANIAILRTLGASPRSIMSIFIVQGTTIGLVGSLLGVLLGVLLALNVEAIVGWIEQMFNIRVLDPHIYYISQSPSDVHWNDVGLIGAGCLPVVPAGHPVSGLAGVPGCSRRRRCAMNRGELVLKAQGLAKTFKQGNE